MPKSQKQYSRKTCVFSFSSNNNTQLIYFQVNWDKERETKRERERKRYQFL